MSIEEKLLLNKFVVDKIPHITLKREFCSQCDLKPCLHVCPVQNFKLEKGEIVFDWAGCLECGSCRIVCKSLGRGAVEWNYPRGGFGIVYRYG
ncbi:MAG: ferredoxin family protein [Candidatus Hecatellales archaeon]|nr:MAG: ferredoxin family protein [Candidatus Hecatellales archaeon]RLI33514.1 MAG: ferredoxin family protein [Candidatus Bathyarchaeota archaeon]